MSDVNVASILEMAYVSKIFYDHGRRDEIPFSKVDEDDNFEFCTESALGVFAHAESYWDNEDEWGNGEDTVYIFRDPMMDRYFRLCRRYEREKGIARRKDPYRAKAVRALNMALNFNSYCYDCSFRANESRKDGCMIIFRTSCEFYFAGEVVEGFWELLDFYTKGVKELESILKIAPAVQEEAA